MSGSALSLSTAGDLSQAAYQNLENGSTCPSSNDLRQFGF